MSYITHSPKQTQQIANDLVKSLQDGDIVLLSGELGAGKTTFTKGIAKGLGVSDDITSPTFTLMNVYPLKKRKGEIKQLVNIDTYRLENEQQLIDIGVEDYLGDKNTICVIEWPEKMEKLLENKKTIDISIEVINKDERKIIIKDI